MSDYKPHIHKGQRSLPKEEQEVENQILKKDAKAALEALNVALTKVEGQEQRKVCHRIIKAVHDLIKDIPDMKKETEKLNQMITKIDESRALKGKKP